MEEIYNIQKYNFLRYDKVNQNLSKLNGVSQKQNRENYHRQAYFTYKLVDNAH